MVVNRSSRAWRWFSAACAAALLGGCRPETPKAYPVVGSVVYKGAAAPAVRLAGTTIYWESLSEPSRDFAQATVEGDGSFMAATIVNDKNVNGAPLGEYRGRLSPPRAGLLDPRFEKYETAGLRLTVAPRPNLVTIEVEPPPP